MAESPRTRPSLLLRLRDATDREAWNSFAKVYGPLIYGFGRKQGLQDADAADLMQDVLGIVNNSIRKLDYDPKKGSFRGWLFMVSRNQMYRLSQRLRKAGRGSGDSEVLLQLQDVPDRAEPDAEWNDEFERTRFAWAAERVRVHVKPTTWQAFWRTTIDGETVQNVATSLGISVSAVYLARSRIVARMREALQELDD